MFQLLQPTPVALTISTTLTIAQMTTRIIGIASATAVNLTLPTGTLCDAGLASGNLPIGGAFDWCLQNTGSAAGIATLLAGTGHAIKGLATLPILASCQFRTLKTAANTFETWRIS